MKNSWTEEEIIFLIKNYKNNGVSYCCNHLNKTNQAVYLKAFRLGLSIEERWTDEEDAFLIKNYSDLGMEFCCNNLNRTKNSIINRIFKLDLKLITTSALINIFNIIHDNKYQYDFSIYVDCKTKISITCPIHGEFKQLPYEHKRGKGCPICKESKGEKEIRRYLDKLNIKFIPQYKFDTCKNINKLPFDFYLPELNICVEFHGRQHYEPIKWFGGNIVFEKLKARDNIKFNYCKDNNIKLVVIKYSNNIDKMLSFLV